MWNGTLRLPTIALNSSLVCSDWKKSPKSHKASVGLAAAQQLYLQKSLEAFFLLLDSCEIVHDITSFYCSIATEFHRLKHTPPGVKGSDENDNIGPRLWVPPLSLEVCPFDPQVQNTCACAASSRLASNKSASVSTLTWNMRTSDGGVYMIYTAPSQNCAGFTN